MAVKLEKLVLPSPSEIELLPGNDLMRLALVMRERIEYYQGLLFRANKRQFGRSSEKSPKAIESVVSDDSATSSLSGDSPAPPTPPTPRTKTTKKLSARYPSAPIQVENIRFDKLPCCPQCGKDTQDSGMTEDAEYLTTSPREYIIVRQKRQKNRCQTCHAGIVTAPAPARIIPGGSYSDEMIVDATLSKYCDLIPIERYCAMAARNGLLGLPPHSLITPAIRLGEFLNVVYRRIKQDTLNTKVLLADETPHRMLEGDAKSKWYLWAFSSQISCFFECHGTRSGDVSTAVLVDSVCEYLLTDVYSGYQKSIRLANEIRVSNNLPIVFPVYCNSHARRQFKDKDSDKVCDDAESMIRQYAEIYRLNAEAKDKSPDTIMEKRAEMRPIFEAMRREAEQKINGYSSSTQMYSAYNYFIKNYEGLTRFLDNHLIPIDNNHSERLLRNHVVGRKTWYGTHSRRAAEAAAVHFTIVESCKIIGVNPREFYLDAVKRIHANKDPLTPIEYKQTQSGNTC